MRFISTHGQAREVDFAGALELGLAPDGGLYIPERFPELDLNSISRRELSMPGIAKTVLAPFLTDVIFSRELDGIVDRAFDFPMPLVRLGKDTAVLELFHGPTSAFKDVGARFLAESLSALHRHSPKLRTVLVATSGDTGGAVAAAFHGKPGFEVYVLFPRGRISPRQEKQLTCWGGNVRSIAIRGTFDDCQRLVKEAFQDPAWKSGKTLTSANSINIGRILPQAVYYALASMNYYLDTGERPGFIIPSGNLGNSVGALWAKKMGFPVGKVVLACNSNRAVSDYVSTGKWKSRDAVATLANAMDVGNPSNMERIFQLYPELSAFNKDIQVFNVSDEEIRDTIVEGEARWGRIWCPHTATAAFCRGMLSDGHWIMVATAHPAKFETIVEPLIGRSLAVPAALSKTLSRPSFCSEADPLLTAIPID